MPISHHAELPNTTIETYDEVNEKINFDGDPPSGLIFHAASPREDGGFRVFEVAEIRQLGPPDMSKRPRKAKSSP
jgi:hypothetical protein